MAVNQKSPHAVILTKQSDQEFRVERVFDHPIERVWAAYTDPALIPRWWGNDTTVAHMDVREGGTWRFVSKSAEGQEFATSGDFLEVTPPTRLVQTFGMEGPYGGRHTQTIEFEPVGDGTRLAITSRFDTTEERDQVLAYGAEKGAIGGWARLDALLKRLAA
jgi:uncharacterized protein YndB with AHSA1/START domain